MTKFKGIFLSRKLDIGKQLFPGRSSPHPQPSSDRWTDRPFGSLSNNNLPVREHGLVTSSTFPPSPDRKSELPRSSGTEEEGTEKCVSPTPAMDLSTSVSSDPRSLQRITRYSRDPDVESYPNHEGKNMKKVSIVSSIQVHNYGSHENEWERLGCHTMGHNDLPAASLTADSQAEEPSSVNSPSECSSMSMSHGSPAPSVNPGHGRKRKRRPEPIPEDCKDDAYWERRKRNNESAKRSREMRRMKEQQTTMRVIYLEQDNLRLKTEVDMLRSELEKVREIVYNRSGNFH